MESLPAGSSQLGRIMRNCRWLGALAGALVSTLVAGHSLQAQTATQTVTFRVIPISRVSVSGAAAPVTVNSAVAGSAPTSAAVGGSSYAITTNETNQKISAALDQALPSGVSLAVTLAAPAGAC